MFPIGEPRTEGPLRRVEPDPFIVGRQHIAESERCPKRRGGCTRRVGRSAREYVRAYHRTTAGHVPDHDVRLVRKMFLQVGLDDADPGIRAARLR